MMSEKILACPYCGSDQVEPRETWGKRYVYCNDCNATGPTTNQSV
jgi:formate dehydrogenase maturation protein FdhE